MYIKNGKLSNGKYIVTDDGTHIVNPTHQTMLDNGWVEYEVKKESEKLIKFREIKRLKAKLESTDYKVTKIAEALAIGSEMPYNAQELHQQRQAIRDRINKLEMEVQGGENEQ